MNKEEVRKILEELVYSQVRANLPNIIGGIVDSEESKHFNKKDLQRYTDALNWFDENIMDCKP